MTDITESRDAIASKNYDGFGECGVLNFLCGLNRIVSFYPQGVPKDKAMYNLKFYPLVSKKGSETFPELRAACDK